MGSWVILTLLSEAMIAFSLPVAETSSSVADASSAAAAIASVETNARVRKRTVRELCMASTSSSGSSKNCADVWPVASAGNRRLSGLL